MIDTNNTIVAVGDVHGCYDELMKLLDITSKLVPDDARYVFLGDYVDRGPDSKKVVQHLMDVQRAKPDTICLKGNHDDMMTWGQWHDYIQETLNSYWVKDPAELPHDHVEWIKGLPLYHQDDMGRVYVHAAIDRSLPLNEQKDMTMLWGRDPYLSDTSMDGGYVVHGHTPVRGNLPEVWHNRCAVDTGACFGKVLSAAIFTDDKMGPTTLVNHRGIVHNLPVVKPPILV